MSNSSIYAAFERMWLYVITKIGNTKSEIEDNINIHIFNNSNPHGVTKSQLGLSNVENKSAEAILSEMTKSNIIDVLGYTPSSVIMRSWTEIDLEG